MNERMSAKLSLCIALALGTLSLVGATTLAATPPSTGTPAVSKENREKMAAIHEQMAACLRSDKAIADCHSEMRKSCKDLGPEACPMMSGMHHSGHGHQGPQSMPPKQ